MIRLSRPAVVAALLAAAAALALAGSYLNTRRGPDAALEKRIDAALSVAPGEAVPCIAPGAQRPLLLLVLGQSNAGNHAADDGPPATRQPPEVTLLTATSCQRSGDPLPGATGQHRSLWSLLPQQLKRQGEQRDVVFALLAVDSTSIDDWTRQSSPLRGRLQQLLAQLSQTAWVPDLVLWQQGESDARMRTSPAVYAEKFLRLRAQLRGAGVQAPMVLARSTLCGTADGTAVREALVGLVQKHADLRLGPDTDALTGASRSGACHFSQSGREQAAALWAQTLLPLLPPARP
jgi:hypothetical protein